MLTSVKPRPESQNFGTAKSQNGSDSLTAGVVLGQAVVEVRDVGELDVGRTTEPVRTATRLGRVGIQEEPVKVRIAPGEVVSIIALAPTAGPGPSSGARSAFGAAHDRTRTVAGDVEVGPCQAGRIVEVI